MKMDQFSCFEVRIAKVGLEGVGRFPALRLTFLGNYLDIPFQQTKAVAENCSDVAPIPPLKHLCALCVLCGSPPHPAPETFRCRPRGFRTASSSTRNGAPTSDLYPSDVH